MLIISSGQCQRAKGSLFYGFRMYLSLPAPRKTHTPETCSNIKKSFICLLNYFKTVVLRGLPTFSLPIFGGGSGG